MASLLRGFRYPFGYFSSIARSMVVNGAREANTVNFVQPIQQCLCGNINGSGFATVAARRTDSLEKSLQQLDIDAKRSGRISRQDIEDVLRKIRRQRSATSSQSLSVLFCCGNLVPDELPEVRTQLVQKIWKTLNDLNVPMDISHYNALLRVYIENEYNFSPTEFLVDLEQKGIEPNRVTYQRLISRYCQQGDIEGATKILEFMKEKQLPVNENVFNALIMGHSQAGDIESASGILQVMKQAGLDPSSDTYTTLLCGYAKNGNIEKMKEIFSTCEKSEIFLLDRDILEVVYSLAINGHAEHVDFLLEKVLKTAGYNHDAVNCILRLINKGHEEVAVKIFNTMPPSVSKSGETRESGVFFVRQLVKANRPAESVLKICRNFEANNTNSHATLIALEFAVKNKNADLTFAIARELEKSGQKIKYHFFWPFLCSAKNDDEVLNVLQKMQEELKLIPNVETVREYAVPHMKEKDYDKIIAALLSAGINKSTAVHAVLYKALQENNISEAARIIANNQFFYQPGVFSNSLLKALSKTKDIDSFITIVRHMYENLLKLKKINNEEEIEDAVEDNALEKQDSQGEMLGKLVFDAAAYFKNNRAEMVHKILEGLVNQGLTISNNQATRIEEKMGADLTPEISTMLGKLSTGELQPTAIERPSKSGMLRSSAELEQLIKTLETKTDSDTTKFKSQLLFSLIRENKVEKLEACIEKLTSDGFVMNGGLCAKISEVYAINGNLEKAVETVNKIKQKEPDFTLDRLKSVRIAQLYLDADRSDDAIKFLEMYKHDKLDVDWESFFNYKATVWRLLDSIAEKGNAKLLKQVFDTLVAGNYCQPNNQLLGTLIKVHLVNDDLENAIKSFEEICQVYRLTPWRSELACRLIEKEDAAGLQKLTDLSTDIHGEVNSLYDLVFSFIECGRIRQARKILETPGLETRKMKINSACERYAQQGRFQPLEGLIEATKNLNHIDRMDIYYNLLLSYVKENELQKALELWTKLQEENFAPSDKFLITLAEFMKKNDITVRFVVPGAVEESKKKEIPKKQQKPSGNENLRAFRSALANEKLDEALDLKSKLGAGEQLRIIDKSHLIEAFVKADRLSEAKAMVLEMLTESTFPVRHVFRFYLNKVAKMGDTATFEQLKPMLEINPDLKKALSFENKYIHALTLTGNGTQYFETLEKNIVNAKSPEEIQNLAKNIPLGGILAILDKHPELFDRFETIAETCAKNNVLGPINMLWACHFISNNDTKADAIFTKYLSNEPRLLFSKILNEAEANKDENMCKKLLQKVKSSKLTEGPMGKVYSCLINVHALNNKFDEAVKVIEEASSEVGIEKLDRPTLLKVKQGLTALNKDVPFVIPKRNQARAGPETSSSSSSSSSDDEVTEKK
ncbi:leucine-rich PPR motif-containing protein, mitochondrial [Culicoides brevitarsis]|uniref:leucine-rich PPR motif-containing protein, mitochondrial n=1 Tax=Culicoides brevitarsis TaxID=469753 RepID=UPI00307B2A4C